MEESGGRRSQKWSRSDVLRVEGINVRDGDNHLPITKKYDDTPTWQFYERYIHILEGDTDFDFDDFSPEDLRRIDWQELKIVTQKMKGEEPEEYNNDTSNSSKENVGNMKYVRDFLIYNFGKDFGIQELVV